ncbi:hypothetical protein [Sinomonas atrocyanea]|uniref:hypothetical protein n=1 Tax=Sinomonas atrocyanea TaxID=37927 RepID=UPI002788DFB9|nr:hypothetical protein [Sinomonas atrocyanea]MDQ0261195.1 hypothetical protein [Sinomonas atrocyanea]MDR6619871.1 hypothetical protein [Sinomonas atrocyanea]
MSQHLDAPLLTLPDVARLARVKRPVVSVWRTRAAGTDHPFPAARGTRANQELFDASEIGEWLEATRRGNNPEALADADAFSIRSALDHGSPRIAAGLEALLALARLVDSPLDTLSSDGLLDEADDADPEDSCLWTELNDLGDELSTAARYTRRLINAAYNPAAAFEQLTAAHLERTSLPSPEAIALIGSAGAELLRGLIPEAALADPVPGCSELTLAVLRALPEGAEPRILLADDGGPSCRGARRRLLVHGTQPEALAVDSEGHFAVTGAAVLVAHLVGSGQEQTLGRVENIALQMDDRQRAVVLAPARALTDPLSDKAAEALRADLLRGGRVRAVVRLPEGALPSRPREAQALWILGPAHADVELSDRWTMVADLTGHQLTRAVREDLVGDIAASLLDQDSIWTHSYRFARITYTRTLLATRGSLVQLAGQPAKPSSRPAELELHLDALLDALGTDARELLGHTLSPGAHTPLPAESIERLIAAGNLACLPGTRMDSGEASSAGDGTRLLGVRELMDPTAIRRTVDLLEFTALHPSARLTEPGDVVFCTSPRPAAVVDEEGASAVPYPARILRISQADPGGLSPALLAADINARPAGDRHWKQWRARRLPEAQRGPLAEAMGAVVREQAAARVRLERLAELNRLLADAVASGALALEPTEPAREEGR